MTDHTSQDCRKPAADDTSDNSNAIPADDTKKTEEDSRETDASNQAQREQDKQLESGEENPT